MTKEKLEEEANAKYKTGSYPQLHPDHFAFIHGYLAGAEPREKRIEELEEKLEQTEKDLADYQFNYPTIKELEKENAKLKKANETLYTMNNDMWVELEEKRAESQGITNRLHQLIEAKEIIKELLDTQNRLDPYRDIFKDRILKAEQFLKEIEK